jgi:uncharacterized repeat protein (TIGR03803 family)
VLYSFTGGSDGCTPYQGLVEDDAGNLYGTSRGSDCSSYGVIFKVDSAGSFTLLHTFTGSPSNGEYPAYGHLTMDESGNLYGVTIFGGAHGYGALYTLSKSGTLTLLHSFAAGASDGGFPVGTVAQDAAGNFYGATQLYGSDDLGTVWKMSQAGKETVLHNFRGLPGCIPSGGLVLDPTGNLYGVTQGGCTGGNYGTVYKVNPRGKRTVLHNFEQSDGAEAYGEVLRTTDGTLFGTAVLGGDVSNNACYGGEGCGTVWSFVP